MVLTASPSGKQFWLAAAQLPSTCCSDSCEILRSLSQPALQLTAVPRAIYFAHSRNPLSKLLQWLVRNNLRTLATRPPTYSSGARDLFTHSLDPPSNLLQCLARYTLLTLAFRPPTYCSASRNIFCSLAHSLNLPSNLLQCLARDSADRSRGLQGLRAEGSAALWVCHPPCR